MSLTTEYEKLIKDLDEVISLGNDGLLKSERMYETVYATEDRLKELSVNLDERSRLSIEKNIPLWRNVPKTGVFVSKDEATRRITPLRALLSELFQKESGQLASVIKNEMVITAGKQYEGRLYLRQILAQASCSVFIRDSYFKPIVLDILLEYLLNDSKLKITILMAENNRLAPFRASYQSFRNQYQSFDLEARYSVGNNADHPRYILIDDQLLFNPDHSLDQWGESTVNIHQLTDNAEVVKVKDQLVSEWNLATVF